MSRRIIFNDLQLFKQFVVSEILFLKSGLFLWRQASEEVLFDGAVNIKLNGRNLTPLKPFISSNCFDAPIHTLFERFSYAVASNSEGIQRNSQLFGQFFYSSILARLSSR